MVKIFKKYLLIGLFNLGLLGCNTAMAQNASNQSFSISNLVAKGQEDQQNNIAAYIVNLINILSLIIGSFALLAIIVGGIRLLTSGGSEDGQTKGKSMIVQALIGLVVAFAAYFITAGVQSLLYDTPK